MNEKQRVMNACEVLNRENRLVYERRLAAKAGMACVGVLIGLAMISANTPLN
jgi:hypothetical protein